MARSNRNDGKSLESVIQAALQAHHTTTRSNYVRLYDKTSTGGRGFAWPGDFYWFLPKMAVLVECKSTATCRPLLPLIRSSKTSKDQIPKHKLHHLSGHPSIYIYGDLLNDTLTVYNGISVVAAFYDRHKEIEVIATSSVWEAGGLLSDTVNYFKEL